MNFLFRLALIVPFSAICCSAQTATVTFYSQNFSTKSEGASFLPKSEQPFGGLQGGWVLDGPQRLARVRAGRFVTFYLNPGEHSFTDDGPTGPSKKPVVINAKDGGQYCIRLFAKMTHFMLVGNWENQIVEVPCEQARREAAHLKPIKIERVDPAVRAEFDTAPTFPEETPPQASPMKSPLQ